jgi:hypothetical protein
MTVLVGMGPLNAQSPSQRIKIGPAELVYSSTDLRTMWSQNPVRWPSKTPWVPAWPAPPDTGLFFDLPVITLRTGNLIKFISQNVSIDEWTGNPGLPNPFGIDCVNHTRMGWHGIPLSAIWIGGSTRDIGKRPDQPPSVDDRISPPETQLRRVGSSFIDVPYVPNVYKITAADAAASDTNKYPSLKQGDLLGLVHVETSLISSHDGPYTMGMAYSKNNGDGWVYCGDIVRTANNISEGTDNITGIPYCIVDGWFYVYFCDYPATGWCVSSRCPPKGKRPCVARARLREVMEKASAVYADRSKNTVLDQHLAVEPFHKYVCVNETGTYSAAPTPHTAWDGEVAAPLERNTRHAGADIIGERPRVMAWVDLHSDAAFCTPLGKYLMTVSNGIGDKIVPGTLMLYSSVNGLDWNNPIVVDSASEPGHYIEKAHSFFVSLYSDASDDSHVVGKEFYIYIPYTYLSSVDQSWPEVKQALYRHKVTIVSN